MFASSNLQTLINWFPAREIKYPFTLEVITKGIDLGNIPEPKSFRSIVLCIHCPSKPGVTIWYTLFKTCNVKLSVSST